jgi:O-acetylserine/cysteine efflux transporter
MLHGSIHDHSLVFHDLSGDAGAVNRRDSLLAALVATIWGFNFIVIDWGMEGVPPLLFAAIRFAVVVFPAILLVPRPAVSWRVLAAVGVFMSLGQFGFLYVSMAAGMPPGLAALVLQAQVIFTIAIAAGVLRERPTAVQVAGVGLGTLGLVVVGAGRGGHVTAAALVLCLLGAFSWGIGNVVSRAARVRAGLSLTVWSAVVVPVPLFALSLAVDGLAEVGAALAGFSWQAVLSTAYTAGLASLVGYGIFNSLLSRNPSASVVPWVLLAPVVAMASAWLLLGQAPNAAEATGGALLIVGVLVALRPSPRARTRLVRPDGAPSGLEPRDRDPERRAGDVVEPHVVEEVDRRGVTSVLTADPEVQVRVGLPTRLCGAADERADSLDVERLER